MLLRIFILMDIQFLPVFLRKFKLGCLFYVNKSIKEANAPFKNYVLIKIDKN